MKIEHQIPVTVLRSQLTVECPQYLLAADGLLIAVRRERDNVRCQSRYLQHGESPVTGASERTFTGLNLTGMRRSPDCLRSSPRSVQI